MDVVAVESRPVVERWATMGNWSTQVQMQIERDIRVAFCGQGLRLIQNADRVSYIQHGASLA